MFDRALLEQMGIDAGEGLAYCADDPEFYVEMLGEYVAEGSAKTEALERFFEARDWTNYAIQAHSVKSVSRMIGAAALSELARGQETAARDGDEEVVLTGHPRFTSEYAALLAKLRELLSEP